jgi:hypothetical protein
VQWTGPPACDQWCRAAASPSVALMPVRARTHVRPCALTYVRTYVRTMSTGRDRCMPPYKGCVAPSGKAATCHMAISATCQSAARVRAGSHCSTECRPSAVQWRVEPSLRLGQPGVQPSAAQPSPAAAAAAAAAALHPCGVFAAHNRQRTLFEQNSLRCRRLCCAARAERLATAGLRQCQPTRTRAVSLAAGRFAMSTRVLLL